MLTFMAEFVDLATHHNFIWIIFEWEYFLAFCLLRPSILSHSSNATRKISIAPRLLTLIITSSSENVKELNIYFIRNKMPKKSSKFALFFAFIAICTAIPFGNTFSTDGFDPYQTLGLEMGATQNEIKQAYKKLAMEWHPDRNKSPGAQERFMEVNRAYEILSNVEKREAYDKFGKMDENFAEWRNYQEQFFKEQQQHFQQYIRWPPPPRRQQNDLKNFILPFASVLGTLFFIFLIGFVLNQMNSVEANTNRRRQNEEMSSSTTRGNNGNNKGANKEQQEWHPEDPKTPLTEEEKQQRLQTRIWRTMGPLIHELRAETQFGLIRLLKPGCRSIIVLVDKESKETLLQQFARYTYCLRNNKTFSFGFLVVPKNLNWFRSLLELTLPGGDEQQQDESKEDLNSLTTVTTDTNSNKQEKEPDEKGQHLLGQFTIKAKRNEAAEKKMTAKDRLKNINPKHTVGTILVICGWKLYFSIYHPMHRPTSLRTRNAAVQLETLGDNEEDGTADKPKCWQDEELLEGEKTTKYSRSQRKGSDFASKGGKGDNKLNVANVLNGFSTFLERLLEGTVRRYYIPEWPENLV